MSMYTPMASEEEGDLAAQILALAHCEQAGVLTAQAAIDIFGRSGLSFEQLRDIWNLSDQNQSGELSKNELTVAIRLMGWVQAGETLHADLVTKAGPLPTLEGISDVRKPNHVQFPPISSEDIHHFQTSFARAGPVSGLLDSNKTMSAFLATSSLSYEQLLKIAKLADIDARGVLDFAQFALGLYLINAFQSCLIPAIPTSIPKSLFNKFTDIRPPDFDTPAPLLHRSTSSLGSPNTQLRITPPGPGNSTPLLSINTNGIQEQPWAILPHEKLESDQQFVRLDVEHKGYIETDVAAKFLMGYDLPPNELGRIWMLADLNRDNRLTQEEFAIVMHLLRQRLAGEPVPDTLPSDLLSPTLRLQFGTAPSLAPPFPPQKAKPPPPPPKKEHLQAVSLNGRVSRAHTVSTSPSPTMNPRYSTALSPPLSPSATTLRPRASMSLTSSPAVSFSASPPRPKPPTPLMSPFEDPSLEAHTNPPSRNPTPPSLPPASMVERSALDALEQAHKRETGRLQLVIDSLRSQLSEQGQLREANASLDNENKSLKSQLRDMERTVSDMLSANDRLGSQEQYVSEIGRLTAEVEAKDAEVASSKRVLDVLKQEEQGLRASLRESQTAATKAQTDADDLRTTGEAQKVEIEELKSRLADMSKAMSEPSSTANNRELRVLLRDATKDNDRLKSKLRETETSMEQLLLSGRRTTQMDELQRENRRLNEQIQEMNLIAMTVQSSSSSSRDLETMRRENEQLKDQLKEGRRVLGELRQENESKLVAMQQKVDSMTHENRLLKIEASARPSRSRPQEDNSVPPPAYDDSFVLPP
ncbi:hypothetical protein HYPSUDRAFT_64689 [Hypholoma sublateritium FD-334 SS-4]|uniref:Uncharacterized protein n=1 Tax=Hypholoma sublateritium (strain FD-334 SS-4) TaxID=945553 RepID=A0A0D2MNK9_HYPSF|nr:hypothetical protein HYPSUDRAFT_64689 [Hypholoma sublateritium FD-334 SS-4]